MDVIYFILYLVAIACFAVAAFAVDKTRFNLVAAGLLAWVLIPALQYFQTQL